MRINLKRVSWTLLALGTVLFLANSTYAQEDKTPKKRLRTPATVKGFIGGESHDSYVIRARKGQIMKVQISWRRKDDNRAEFTVSESPNFFNGEQVTFGKSSDDGKSWSGRVPKAGNYYVYVVAHPTANYTLSVTVK